MMGACEVYCASTIVSRINIMSITRTQVRIPDDIHVGLKQYATKHDCSMNEAITRLVGDGILMDSIKEPENKDEYLKIINTHLPNMSIKNIKEVCKLTAHLSNMESIA